VKKQNVISKSKGIITVWANIWSKLQHMAVVWHDFTQTIMKVGGGNKVYCVVRKLGGNTSWGGDEDKAGALAILGNLATILRSDEYQRVYRLERDKSIPLCYKNIL
jgi:hypothetical protein